VSSNVLIVDDDVELNALLAELLEPEGYVIDTHVSGIGALPRATSGQYALVILDVMLPGHNGFEVLQQIRRCSTVPVILLTAKGDHVDRIVGLELGADDYIPKPFNPRELVARIRAVLRRTQREPHDGRGVVIDDVSLDPGSRRVTRDEQPVDLTSVEFELLRILLESAGHVVGRETLAEVALGRPLHPLDRSIDMHISKLRRKLGERVDGMERIKTVRGMGYIYVRDEGD
jgi:two-component system response regulator CpxR